MSFEGSVCDPESAMPGTVSATQLLVLTDLGCSQTCQKSFPLQWTTGSAEMHHWSKY